MAVLFISDLHLALQRPAVTRAFLAFLQGEARSAEALYILGDFFEVWVGDDDDAPFADEILAPLRALAGSVPCFFMRGNRDFLAGEDFARRSGCTLLPDPTVIDLHGRPALLMHGDSLCTRDEAYMAFRRQARDPAWQQQLLAQPLTARRALAQQLREQSQAMTALKAEDIMDVTPEEVDAAMRAHGVDLLIHGHTHRPAVHVVPAGRRIVLGDWCEQGWLLRATPGELQLVSFPLAG